MEGQFSEEHLKEWHVHCQAAERYLSIYRNIDKMAIKETSKRKRLLNCIIDLIVIGILMEITFRVEEIVDNKSIVKIIRAIIVFGGYYIFMEYFLSKTVGKYFTKSKVVNKDGSKISFKTAIMRYMCRWIPFEFISLGLGRDAEAWHDTLSKTLVIEDDNNNGTVNYESETPETIHYF
jgi:uncharacterized RDD family membrane protein YckC